MRPSEVETVATIVARSPRPQMPPSEAETVAESELMDDAADDGERVA